MMTVSLILFVFLAAAIGVKRYQLYAKARGLLDIPNSRSSHVTLTPRGGGLVVVAAWSAGTLFLIYSGELSWKEALALLPGAALIAAVGLIDDFRSLSPASRAAAHIVACLLLVAVAGGFSTLDLGFTQLQIGFAGAVLAVFSAAWSINLYNFMDGIDGIAGIEGIFIFVVGGFFLWHGGAIGLATSCWILAAALCGFLIWNFPPAKIFMGDVGSGTLGFLVAAFALLGEIFYQVPALLWLILYGVFFFDATVTLLRRIWRGEKWYAAHRSHAYQRLHHQRSWSHHRIDLGVILINFFLACIAIWSWYQTAVLGLGVILALVICLLAFILVERVAPFKRP